ncbi:hypothetical protein [Streptomyces sp. NPDC020917]|uniref:hypothetical protein n=1 Tax=Streptomyces sp. NPDC020917 TaxID=3365102 RepID=UPI0037A86161
MSFTDPDPWHAPATYWFWQRVPTDQEISEQLDAMEAAGFGSFQIQARLSFPRRQYLDESFLGAYARVAEQAAARGLMMGVYDEYNWLSGHAGGRTVEGRDDLRERHMFFSSAPAGTGGQPVECPVDAITAQDVEYLLQPGRDWVFDGGAPRWADWEIVAAFAHPRGPVTGEAQIVDVTGRARLVRADAGGCTVSVPAEAVAAAGADAEVTVFTAARCTTSRMINYLLPQAAERFVEVGYEPLARALGEHLGTTVRYVFFDQPHGCFYHWRQLHDATHARQQQGETGHVTASLMYAPSVVPEDRRVLLSLARDVGPRTGEWRSAFFERYARTGIDAFFGTLSRWCRDHGVALSGHEVLGYVSSWDPTSTVITDDPRTNFGTDYFAVDRLRDLTAVDARNDHPQLAAKFGDSLARAHGRSGCLVEQYFASTDAGTHFAEGAWELTLGRMRAAAVRHHLLGARQLLTHAFWLTDTPADPQDAGQVFTDPRLDFPPGVNFEPWFSHHRALAAESGRLSEFLDAASPLPGIALLYPLRTSWAGGPDHPYGAHFAFWAEHLARAGHEFRIVEERQVRDGLTGDTTALVLPGAEVLEDTATLAAVATFVEAGGTLLASGPLPRLFQHGDGGPAATERTKALLAGPRGAYWPELPLPHEVDSHLAAVPGPRAATVEAATDVWTSRRAGPDGGTRLALFNDTGEPRAVTVRPAALPARLSRWDGATGQVTAPSALAGELTLLLRPAELACLQVEDAAGAVPVPAPHVLDTGWTLALDGRELAGADVRQGWERQGFAGTAGEGVYRARFALPAGELEQWPAWQLVLPAVAGSARADIDGQQVGAWGWGPFACEVPAGVLTGGTQTLTITVASSAVSRYAPDRAEPCGLLAAPVLRPALTAGA